MLELLDQVEDVISVEDSVSDKVEESPCQIQDINNDELTVKVDLSAKGEGLNLPEVMGSDSHCNFLVLEVFFTTSTAQLTKDMNFSEIDFAATYPFIRYLRSVNLLNHLGLNAIIRFLVMHDSLVLLQ